MPRHYHSYSDLPQSLPLFPLSGVVLLPRGQLPLNVFEPRYLEMVDYALTGDRLIGMIQPAESEDKTAAPHLTHGGCAGKQPVISVDHNTSDTGTLFEFGNDVRRFTSNQPQVMPLEGDQRGVCAWSVHRFGRGH